MPTWAIVLLSVGGGLAVLCCAGVAVVAFLPEDDAGPTRSVEGGQPAEPVTVSGECDAIIDTEAVSWAFVADVEVTNQLDEPVTVEAWAEWAQAGRDPVRRDETVELAAGETVDVHFDVVLDDDPDADIIRHTRADNECEIGADPVS